MRPKNRHPKYHNLYFVGASTHPGTGVPTALVSGRLAATRLLEEAAIAAEQPKAVKRQPALAT
jgi:phytoene dehydrogenase-like protein